MERRFAYLRPGQWTALRDEAPIAYLPMGTLEWHGLHMPMGADALQAEALALRCAELTGGVVFPPLYYGESRSGSLLETDPKYRDGIAQRLGLTGGELDESRNPYTHAQQLEHEHRHLVHVLAETASYGFQLAVFVAGHYPLLDNARSAILTYNQWGYDKPWGQMKACAFGDYKLLRGVYDNPGDHAGAWETSHLLCSDPDTVDMALAQKEWQYGVLTTRDPAAATAAFGEEIYAAAAEHAAVHIRRLLESPEHGHGIDVDLKG